MPKYTKARFSQSKHLIFTGINQDRCNEIERIVEEGI
jgi:hypothetical protein